MIDLTIIFIVGEMSQGDEKISTGKKAKGKNIQT